LEVKMKELLKLDESGNQTVSARELHVKLEINTRFNDWFPRICEYGFIQGKDFNLLKKEQVQNEGGREVKRQTTDYLLTLSMAKELAMLQRTEQGREIRRYLIKVEEAWNSPQMIMARALQVSQKQIETYRQEIAILKPKAETLDKITATDNDVSVRELASILAIPHLGQNNLFERLRNDGYIDGFNHPYRQHIESGIMYEKEYYVPQLDATKQQLRITQKGVAYFAGKYVRITA
jgi:anti-repressor protein